MDGVIDDARAYAEQVLAENFVNDPPVKITDLIRNYGLTVEVVDLQQYGQRVAGFIDPEKRVIYVNKNDSAARQAFTIAHELGHWLMHQSQLSTEPDKYAILYRKPLGVANPDPIEKQANAFAACLLVPRDMLERYRKDSSINELAAIFGVSTDVIGYRLKHESGED